MLYLHTPFKWLIHYKLTHYISTQLSPFKCIVHLSLVSWLGQFANSYFREYFKRDFFFLSYIFSLLALVEILQQIQKRFRTENHYANTGKAYHAEFCKYIHISLLFTKFIRTAVIFIYFCFFDSQRNRFSLVASSFFRCLIFVLA